MLHAQSVTAAGLLSRVDGVIFITDLFIWNYAARRFASPGFPKFFSGIGRGSHFRSDFKLANCAGKEG